MVLAAALAVAYALAMTLAARANRRAGAPARAVGLALGALVAVNVGVAVATQYGQRLDDLDQKYLLPVYTALPVLLGAGLAELPLAAGATLAGGLLVVQGIGAAMGTLQSLAPAAVAQVEAERRAQLEAVALMEKDGPARLYANDPGMQILTFLSRERVIVSDPVSDHPRYARLVDGAEAVGWWLRGRGPGLADSLTALGARFDVRSIGDIGGTFVNFALTPQGLRELDPGTLAVTASLNSADAGAMVDRDAATFWSSGQAKYGGEWFDVDLGRVEPVALIRWLPRYYREIPAGVVVETSLDRVTWQRLIVLPNYEGPLYWSAGHPVARVRGRRVELRVPPTPARYLRITQTGQGDVRNWTVSELFEYAADPGAIPAPPREDGAALARSVHTAGVTRLYADPGWASRVAAVDPGLHVPPANLALNAYDFRGESELLPEMRWGPGSGALVEAPDADGFVSVARASGVGFTRVDLGGLALFVYAPPAGLSGTPIPASSLRISVSRYRRGPARPSTATPGPGGRRAGRRRRATGSAWTSTALAPCKLFVSGRSSATTGREASSSKPRPTGHGATGRRALRRERDSLGRLHTPPRRFPRASPPVHADHAPGPPPDPDPGPLALRLVRQRADRLRRRLTRRGRAASAAGPRSGTRASRSVPSSTVRSPSSRVVAVTRRRPMSAVHRPSSVKLNRRRSNPWTDSVHMAHAIPHDSPAAGRAAGTRGFYNIII